MGHISRFIPEAVASTAAALSFSMSQVQGDSCSLWAYLSFLLLGIVVPQPHRWGKKADDPEAE